MKAIHQILTKDYYTLEETAVILGWSYPQIRRMVSCDMIRVRRSGRNVFVPYGQIVANRSRPSSQLSTPPAAKGRVMK